MGGGSSKLNAGEGVVVPVKIRPLLLRRFEEFRKRRNGGTLKIEGTLSKKQLLKDSPEEEDSNNSQTSRENETETQEKDNEKEKEQVKEEIMVVISIEKISRVVPLPNTECKCKCEPEEDKLESKEENKEEKDTNTEQDNQEKVFHVDDVVEVHEEEKVRENEQEVDAKSDDEKSDDEDDDNDDESEERGRLVYPGSPSFRIYCIDTESRKEEEEESKNETIACKNEISVVHKKSASADSIHSAASRTSRNSNEVTQIVEIESTRKRKGMKKFGAVRTLLKVKSCYHPMSSCTGDDRRRLLVAKTN